MPDTTTRRFACRITQHAWWALMVGIIAMLAACASPPQADAPESTGEITDRGTAQRWHYLRFRIARDGDEVDSYLDSLIAHQLLAGMISEYESDIALWRFHRRWPDDPTGHQFSFIFLASPAIAERIHARLQKEPLVHRLRDEGHLIAVRLDPADPRHARDPAATSDRSWPPPLRREWPHFIMGASRMWLGLIESEAAKHDGLGIHARYRAVEAALDKLWFKQANHALFHHLSALFGYKPARVIRRDIMTF